MLIKSVVLTSILCALTACGFKSDLFIPGEPKNAGQMDSSSLEILKQRTLESLQNQDSEELDARLRKITDDQPAVDEGVPVTIEPLTVEELEEIEKNQKKKKQQ